MKYQRNFISLVKNNVRGVERHPPYIDLSVSGELTNHSILFHTGTTTNAQTGTSNAKAGASNGSQNHSTSLEIDKRAETGV